ncbi:MAG: universal stress protein [Micrococcales bacterium]|nr:universal stress protein [Micrococcales bacterium]
MAEATARSEALRLVTAYSLPRFASGSLDAANTALSNNAVREGAQLVLDKAVTEARAAGLEASGELKVGDAAGVLVEESKLATLAVVGTRGRGGFAERLLGTVSSALPVHAHCPTVVVPCAAKEVEAGLGSKGDLPIKKIVVGVDGSPASKTALYYAISEALVWGAELTVFTSMTMASGASLFAWAPGPVDQSAIMAELASELDAILQAEMGHHKLPGDFKVHRHALEGRASALLVEFSSAVDLLVVGSRGRGGFSGLLLGSTSQAVLHHAACPAMVVPARVPVSSSGEA